jgi:hypothetical protein
VKEETRLSKLAELLGLSTVVETHVEKKKNLNKVVEVPESEIQDFRAMQGVVYFLQAPELFKPTICKHCGEGFMVSRQYVAFCSYTCLKMDLEKLGIDWNRGEFTDSEKINMTINGVWEGQEPLWIKEPILTRLQDALASLSKDDSITSLSLTP